jgi:hypothetical protein
MTVPRSVFTNPPDEAIVTAVVVLKFATMISRPAEMSNKPTGDQGLRSSAGPVSRKG